jgi:hypothetical protein
MGMGVSLMNEQYPAAALAKLAGLWSDCGSCWVLGGSAGLAVRGAPLDRPPRDLDIYADEEEVPALHACLAAYAVDKPEPSVTGRYRSILSHYRLEGTIVELVGGFRIEVPGSFYETEVRQILHPAGDTFEVGGQAVRVVPPAHELLFNAMRERPDRCAAAGRLMQIDRARHKRVLNSLLGRNRISPDLENRLLNYASRTD